MITHDVSALLPTGFSGVLLNQDWERFMVERNISTEAREDALSRDGLESDKKTKPKIKRRFEHSKIDLISAMTVRQCVLCTVSLLTIEIESFAFRRDT